MEFRVTFKGTICHVLDGGSATNPDGSGKPVSPDRAVLLKDEGRKMHEASLVIDQDYVSGDPSDELKFKRIAHLYVFDIAGYAVRFKGSSGSPSPDEEFKRLVPRLSNKAITNIDSLEDEVYTTGNPPWKYIQSYFELPAGAITAENPVDGRFSDDLNTTVQFPRRTSLTGTTAEEKLEFSKDGSTRISLDLFSQKDGAGPQKDGVAFSISNWPGPGHSSHGGHWKLHYRLGKNTGKDGSDVLPPQSPPRTTSGEIKILISGPGCANSTWP